MSEMKTLAMDLPIETHKRIEELVARRETPTSKKAVASEALNIGLNALEATLDELEGKTLVDVFAEEETQP